jgi:hypothetical protein
LQENRHPLCYLAIALQLSSMDLPEKLVSWLQDAQTRRHASLVENGLKSLA